MRADSIEVFGKSVIQYGPENDRVYLMKLDHSDMPGIITRINNLVALHNYSKVFVKISNKEKKKFQENGYHTEARIPGLFNGIDDGLFMSRFYHKDRLIDHDADRVKKVLDTAYVKAERRHFVCLPAGFTCRLAETTDCDQMSELYQKTFTSYPFPIADQGYLVKTMEQNVLYAGIWKGHQLLALASADIDYLNSNAELTDFATNQDWRGHGLANLLLQCLEKTLQRLEIKTTYTLARATSYGMNICFSQNGYLHNGTLVKNTQIAGGLESMNVWHKHLEESDS